MSIVSFTNSGKLINRQYVTSTYSKGTNSIDKLSQGKKIRKTSDSVAESSINSKLINEVAVLKQSMINSMTYKSKLETAVSGLEQIDKILGEMQRISYKASSYIGTDDDREKLSTEFEELKNHIDFIVDETRYNGDYLLNSFENSPKTVIFGNDYIKFLKGADLDTPYNLKSIQKGKRYSLTNLRTGVSEEADIEDETQLFFKNMNIKLSIKKETPAYEKTDTHVLNTMINDVFGIYLSDMAYSNIANNDKWFYGDHYVSLDIDYEGSSSVSNLRLTISEDNDGSGKIEKCYTERFNFFKNKPLLNVDELVFTNNTNNRFKMFKLHINDAIRNMIAYKERKDIQSSRDFFEKGFTGTTFSSKYRILDMKIFGYFLPKKTHDPKEYSISYVPSSKYNEKFSISSSTALDIGLREEGINLNNEENIKKSIEQVKKAKEIISESISKLSVALNRVDFTMNNIDTMMVNTESAISAITDLDVSDELAKLSVLEMQQVYATEMIAHDIKSKYKLLKI